MHVKIDQDMRVSYNGTLQDLKRDQVVDGPLARWLAEESGCPVTVLDDPQAEGEDAGETEGLQEAPLGDPADDQEAEQDGSLTADLTATSTAAAAPKPTAGKSGAKGK